MKDIDDNQKFSLINDTLWVIRLNLKEAPVITISRFIGTLKNSTNSLQLSLTTGLIINWMIKYTQNGHNQKYIIYSIISFGIYYIINNIASTFSNYGDNMVNFKMTSIVPEKILQEKIQKLGTSTLEDPKIQNLITRYRDNSSQFSDMTKVLLNLISSFIALSIAAISLSRVMPLVTLLMILVSIPGLILNNNIISRIILLQKSQTVNARRAFSIVRMLADTESLKEIRLLGIFVYLKKYYDDYSTNFFNKRNYLYTIWSILDVITIIFTALVILYGIHQIIILITQGQIQVGTLTFYISALINISNNIDLFSSNLTSYGGNLFRLKDIQELLTYPEEDNSNKKIIAKLKNPPLIELKNISFTYPNSDKQVIKNLSLSIKPGEKIAIVGENGAGKTTLVKLISNIYPVSKGEILIDGDNLNKVTPDSWSENLGVLYQDYNTYSDLTVRENIALGDIKKDFNMELVRDAAKKADADEFIEEFPFKYEQVLSEKYKDGTRPSTGQWQKISIARFFYRDAPILILDEPTASIDAIAEANIFDRIYKFVENKTVVIISHRFSTVRNADRIIVFDKGNIVEQGNHTELLGKNGFYAKAFNLQAKGYSD